jgi:hypothetical protein
VSSGQPVEQVIKRAKEQGWDYEFTGNGHHKLTPPGDGQIVVTSGTPGDQRSFKNFLAAMKRSGYKEQDEREELMERRRVRGVVEVVRSVLRESPDKTYKIDELKMITGARVPGASPNSHHNAIHHLMGGGEIKRVGHGEYRWAGDPNMHEMPSIATMAAHEPEPPKPPSSAAPPAAPPPVDDDERELNEVLDLLMTAMSRAEKLLRKYNAYIKKVQELKQLLG